MASALALIAAATPGPLASQSVAAAQAPEWVALVTVTRLSDEFPERPETVNLAAVHPQPWMILNQRVTLPAPLKSRPLDHDTFVVLEVGRRGEATGCRLLRSTSEQRLDDVSCDYLMRPGLFSASIVPREMAPSRWVMTLHWRNETAADYERRQRGFIAPSIRPAMPFTMALRKPPSQGERRWIFGRPLASDFAGITDRRLTSPHVAVDLTINEYGTPTTCEVARSSGNAAVDRRTCGLILGRVRFSERGDAEGRLIADRIRVRVNVGPLVRDEPSKR